jgi:hypothetical protein
MKNLRLQLAFSIILTLVLLYVLWPLDVTVVGFVFLLANILIYVILLLLEHLITLVDGTLDEE